jgi:hypothetical protein
MLGNGYFENAEKRSVTLYIGTYWKLLRHALLSLVSQNRLVEEGGKKSIENHESYFMLTSRCDRREFLFMSELLNVIIISPSFS